MKKLLVSLIVLFIFVSGGVLIAENLENSKSIETQPDNTQLENVKSEHLEDNVKNVKDNYELATFAGGCFWCLEKPFDKVDGVISTTSGYSEGIKTTATYPQVSSGSTKHLEAIQIKFDPAKVSFQQIVNVYWKNIDPFDDRGQFCDRGYHYTSAVYYRNEEQRKIAEQTLKVIEKEKKEKVLTPIKKYSTFFPAEEYHQDFYKKNSFRYKTYRFSCGRDRRLNQIWK